MNLIHQPDKIIFTSEALMTKSTIECKCKEKPAKILLNDKPTEFKFDNSDKLTRIYINKNQENGCLILFYRC